MAGAWRALDNQPAFTVDTMLLLTDGSVMCHENQTPNWHRLIPDAASDYGKGTWHQMASMPANAPASQGGPTNAPLYFASAVLADGRVVVAGGEYNGGTQVDLLAAEIYDPVADRWTSIATPHGWSNIGDAPSTVLQDGRWLLANIMSTETAVFDPASGHWSAGPNKQSVADEEGWTLLPDGSVLTVTVNDAPNAEKYISTSNQWVSASRTPPGHDLVSAASSEIGPGVLMADGRVFVVGATGHTAIYTPPANPSGPGTWTAGPDFPRDAAHNLLCAPDAPACLLPNGRVLCAVGHLNTSGQDSGYAGPPTRFFEFDGTHLTEVPQSPAGSGEMTFSCRLLLLPTGQVLLSTAGGELDLYTPDGAPNPSWAPRIHTAPPAVAIGGTYRISGVQFNGLSQASTYGDDAQMATNYPIARIRHDATGAISYLRTHHHSTMGVATGTRSVSTYISVPKIPLGPGTLTVIANGVPSPAVRINVLATAYQHVTYLSPDGHVHELYDALGAGHWAVNDLTHVAGAPPAAAGSGVTSWVDPAYQHVAYLAADGHVHELYDALGAGHWGHNDLTHVAGAPPAAAGSGVTSWIDPNYQHLVFVSADGHVHELYDALGAGHWSHNDLTAAAGAPSAAVGSAITSWIDPAYQHVVFLSADGHVHELYDALGAGQWAVNDLTHAAGAPPAAAATAITSWIDPTYQHVVYLSADGHVHELYDALGAGHWAANDLIAVAGAQAASAGSAVTAWIDVG